MAVKNEGPFTQGKRSLDRRILRNTTLNILALVAVCCVIMVVAMQSLAKSILLDSLQPMARQSAKTVEANIHMLADRMMTIAGDLEVDAAEPAGQARAVRQYVLTESAETYEFRAVALYGLDGRFIQGVGDAPESLDSGLLDLLRETDNLTTWNSTVFQGGLGVTMGMPVKEDGETSMYVVGVYKYDALNDVISSISLGRNGIAYMIDRGGVVTGHPDQSMVLNGTTLAQLSGGHEAALGRAAGGETGSTEFSIGSKTILAAFSPIRGTQWALVIQIPKLDYNHLINGAMLVAVLATMVGLVASIVPVLRLSRSISSPVKSVTDRMVALADGDLHTEVVPVHSKDELELMTRTLKATVEGVNRYISDIQRVLTQVAGGGLDVSPLPGYHGDFILIRDSLSTIIQSMNGTISGFRTAADRLADMSEELSGQSDQLHLASVEQNQSTEALVSEVSHVKQRLDSVTQSSGQTRLKTQEIAQSVQGANTQMDALSGAMDDISANAQEITKIAKAIEDIAFQTSVLAINASIEAARAGSAGRGFSVVADEVNKLASRSAAAAKDATELVNNTRSIIRNGVELTAATAGSIRSIASVSDQIGAISDQLMVAVEGQEQALTIMVERIDAISAIADRNLQNAGGIQQSSGLLAREAEALRTQVGRFVLKEDQDR